MRFIYSDGGRSKYFKGSERVGDCVTRAIANATGRDYLEIYNALNALAKTERIGSHKRTVSNSRRGVYRVTFDKYLKSIGWVWVSTMSIGSGCRVHLTEDDLPPGVLIVRVSKHLTCVKDGVVYDTFDPTRDGSRCVYGYYMRGGDK